MHFLCRRSCKRFLLYKKKNCLKEKRLADLVLNLYKIGNVFDNNSMLVCIDAFVAQFVLKLSCRITIVVGCL